MWHLSAGARESCLAGEKKIFAHGTKLFSALRDNPFAMTRAALLTLVLGIAVLALTWAAVASARALPATLPHHLLLFVAAGLAWAAATVVVPRLGPSRGQLPIIVVVAVLLRVPAWLTPPTHSDDVYRYLWDGRVQRAGINPYRFAPDAPELRGLRDATWARINNRSLPTIYPPLAQLAFAAAPSPAGWKLLVALADAAVALLLYMGLGERRRVLVWLWSPLVVVELGVNAHVDALGVALLVAALLAWRRRRQGLAGALVGAATAVKLLPIVALAGMRSRRTLAAALAALALVALPYVGAGPRMAGSLGEYGRRWRSNDGVFALLYDVAARGVARTRFGRRYDLGDAPRLARWISGRDRDQVYPDEVANLLARAAAGVLFLGAIGWAVHRRASALRVTEVAFGAFVLLTPALHPWYVVWLIPLVALGGSWAWVVLAVLVPLGYRPLDGWLAGQPWHDPIWTRALEHGATLMALAIDRWQTSSIIEKFGESPRRV